jgi:hypothetical protein
MHSLSIIIKQNATSLDINLKVVYIFPESRGGELVSTGIVEAGAAYRVAANS